MTRKLTEQERDAISKVIVEAMAESATVIADTCGVDLVEIDITPEQIDEMLDRLEGQL